jgi:hypothetical protein
MKTWYVVAIGMCFCASCGRTSDVPHGSTSDATAGSDAEVCGSAMPIPQAHRAVSENCTAERGSIGPVDTTSCADMSRITCTSDADCASGRNGRCLQSAVNSCQTYCSYDDCLADTDCPDGPCLCRSSGTDTTPNYCVTGSNCRTDADCGECGFCSPSVVSNSLACLHHLEGGVVTTCGVTASGNGTQYIEIDLGGCSPVLDLAYVCHRLNDECTNDSDCSRAGGVGYCAYTGSESRWKCDICTPRMIL